MDLIKAKGRLMAIGGGEDKEKECLILKESVRLAGGEKARIVIFTMATDSPEEAAAKYRKIFKRLGAKEAESIDISQRSDAKRAENIERVEKASGIFFTGGDQLHITSLMGGTELQKAIRDSYEKGVIVAGTSAGAAMTYSDIPYLEKGQSLALAGVKIHVLPNSYKFDLKTREIIIPGRAAKKAKAATLNENEKTGK